MRKRYGGFENVGATVDDCNNFRKRINNYIGEYDADMVINRMTDKKQYLADYSFEYSVDDDKRYKMVFVPFTGIDNHYRNVTLGAGLLASESIESYKWILNSFLKSFGRQPKVVVTDQDPAMKQAIEEVGHELCNNDEFKRRMCDIVWIDSIEPEEFERQWKLVMIEFGLTENKWIDDMFVANSQLTLVEFMNHFDGAMDVQRFNHRKNDHISRYTEPAGWSETTLEKDVAKIYTKSIFFDKQIEIHGTISECLPMDTKVEGPQIRILLKDFIAHGDGLLERWMKDVVPNELNVKYNLNVGGKDVQHKAKPIAREIIHTGEDKDNEVEDDEEEDEFEDYSGSSDDLSKEEDQWEEVSEDDEDESFF
ncbi:protein FAR1-RELATED SEQUENCE 6-like [Helianthus annuus]|uniref:protein FAR1-RELATED SEQUENCE 6-like n=1 Tax=Helianthus annuus TaxID=4232 RepID=UPI0016531873|nr:protein FAR1-RELATED SEQUENCE 6-like [Helianthus annuus]